MFYGVCGGPHAGVYTSWDEAKKGSQGVKGALCKKFPDRDQAEAFAFPGRVKSSSCSTASVEAFPLPATPARSTPPSAAAAASVPAAASRAAPAAAAPSAGGKIYLQVPFEEKDEAKALGAKWDPVCKKWYASSPADRARLSRWPVAREDTAAAVRRPPQVDKVPVFSLSEEDRRALNAVDDKLLLYTDGSCLGNTKVAERSNPAGWGVVIVGTLGAAGKQTLLYELFGRVELDSGSDFFLGAEVGSNNTGELCGICEALLWLRDWEPSSRPVAICYDSVYAAKTTSREFKANKNQQLVASSTTLLDEVKKKRQVSLLHVKGHSGHHWNDAVDLLAKRGAAGERCNEGRFRQRAAKREAEGAAAPAPPAAKRPRTASAAA